MNKAHDITGQTINNWYVIKEAGRTKLNSITYLCRCLLCGDEKIVDGHTIRKGTSKSCGCWKSIKKEYARTRDRLYGIWLGIKKRCYNPKCKEYIRYGGRGIIMCDEWKNDYDVFKEWAYDHGYDINAPRGACTIERLDVNGNYSPDNCTWCTVKEQNNNKRDNVFVTYNNETHTLSQWSEIVGIKPSTLRQRINVYKWPIERALTEPIHNNWRTRT